MGDEKQGLLIDAMYVLYQEMMAQLIQARQNMNLDIPILRGDLLSAGDIVLFKDHGKGKQGHLKPPTHVREVCSIIRLLGYLNFFIPAHSEMIRHMTKLMQKNVPFNWDDKCQKSLQLAKEHLQSYP